MGQTVHEISSWAAWPIDSGRFSETSLELFISRQGLPILHTWMLMWPPVIVSRLSIYYSKSKRHQEVLVSYAFYINFPAVWFISRQVSRIIENGPRQSSPHSVLYVSLWYSLWRYYVYCVECLNTLVNSRAVTISPPSSPLLVVLDRMLSALTHQSSLRTRATFSWPTLYYMCCCHLFYCVNTLRTGLLNCLNARSRGSTFRHQRPVYRDRRFATLQRTLFIYLINKYISLSDICLTVHHWYK